ncbi:UDP-N-acetylglucosamine--undecaprenyl-phosphate N-acetylglucosaminephosphotransferase [Vibrio ulleungensis]|uniref:Undecaprenyl-phosphate alpha-N-acetylglucosaminyl 1-phosphate transferase n=1 Tax=Vibrio ulleungensis TaxID=2807619 RepID=A0ABS2HPA7_9VIBR|nr:UDP-N-acetylglucosamine--undecaprenyl-phosphate N-acetylglucosaminephosphotransferase [Vibrio ulleungensis]MBM7037722.1 UDP-N-acetylglucosamine--undecaprenyl-phosphate N-acetylglucosaminephosphotransferase [Vibrio ulleungensis]
MNQLASLAELGFIFIFSLTNLFFLRKVARKINLVDKPNARKLHEGTVPLVGGLSICLSILFFLLTIAPLTSQVLIYTASIILLVTVGVIDDKYDISFKIRFLVQGVLSIVMMTMANLDLHTIGNILGTGDIVLGPFSYIVTVIAVIGAINAFNMVDGIDGLLGGLSIVTFSGLGVLMLMYGFTDIAYFCLVIIVAIVPYILFNLGLLGRQHKVFMGDAGSMLIGFTVIWMLLMATQEPSSEMRPVTALWLIAIPLMDMAAIMIRRIRRGDSPFKPDREHLHHICQRLGLSSRQTLAAISLAAACLAGIGIVGELLNVPEYLMLIGFVVLFLLYLYALTHIWVLTSKFRRGQANQQANQQAAIDNN